MASDLDEDIFARVLAMENAFYGFALVTAGMHAHHSNLTPSESAKLFRNSIEGSLHDTASYPKEVQLLMQMHLKRMFDHLEGMAKHADLGFE